MNTMKKLLVCFCLFLPWVAGSQTLSHKEQRRINLRMLNLLEQYEASASMYDEFAQYAFLEMCDNGTAMVYSDLLDYRPGKKVEVAEYVSALANKENVRMKILNVKRDPYYWKDNAWHTVIRFDKVVDYNDPGGVRFSNEEYYGANHQIALECYYDPQEDRCYIHTIDGSIISEQEHLPDEFVVVHYNTEDDKRIDSNGEPLKFNSFDQAFVPKGSIRGWNDDVRIKADTLAATPQYDYVKLRYNRTPWRFKLRYAMTMGEALEVTTPVDLTTNTSSSTEMGAELGIALPLGRSTALTLWAGAAMSETKLEMGTGAMNYSYSTVDNSGVDYTRHYEISSATESLTFSDLVVPVYLSLDHKLFKNMYVHWSVGAKLYLNGETKVTPYHIEGRTWGNYGTSTVESGAEGFGSISGDYESFLAPNTYVRNEQDLSITAGISLNYNLIKGRLFLFGKYSYEMGLGAVHESDENELFNASQRYYPVVYSAGMNQNVATRSLMDCVSYERKAMWLEFGLMFKF